MKTSDLIFVGTKGQLAAVNKFDGTTVWQAKLKGGLSGYGFVTVLVEDNYVFAQTGGSLFCLDAADGTRIWENDLPGMGYDLAMLATEGASSLIAPIAEQHRRNQASSSSSASTTSS